MADRMLDTLRQRWNVSSRREFFTRAGSGLAGIALSAMLAEDGYAAGVDPLAPKQPHLLPKAKNIIWCFMEGGPSQVDLFDPKPMLEKYALQPMPARCKTSATAIPARRFTARAHRTNCAWPHCRATWPWVRARPAKHPA